MKGADSHGSCKNYYKNFVIAGAYMPDNHTAGGYVHHMAVRPFFSDKFDITKHPKYKYLSDYDKKNAFDVERYMKRRPAIVKPEEPFDCYEISEADLQEGAGNE